MNSYDFNDADTQRNFDVIPHGTIATVRMTVRPGSAGEGGWLRRSKDGGSEALDCEFVVLDGPFAKRKFWTLFTIAGHHTRSWRSGEYFGRETARHAGIRARHQARRHERRRKAGAPHRVVRRPQRPQFHRARRRRAAAERIQGEEPARPRGHVGRESLASGDAGAGGRAVGSACQTRVYPREDQPTGLVKMKKARAIARVSPSAIDDEWQRRATASAIGAARGLVRAGSYIPSGTPVGRLGDTEWGWVFCAMLFAWIATRAEQAAAEQLDAEQTIR